MRWQRITAIAGALIASTASLAFYEACSAAPDPGQAAPLPQPRQPVPRTPSHLARVLTERIDPALRPEHAPAPAGELRFSIADTTAARVALDYRPTRTIENDLDGVIDDIRRRVGLV